MTSIRHRIAIPLALAGAALLGGCASYGYHGGGYGGDYYYGGASADYYYSDYGYGYYGPSYYRYGYGSPYSWHGYGYGGGWYGGYPSYYWRPPHRPPHDHDGGSANPPPRYPSGRRPGYDRPQSVVNGRDIRHLGTVQGNGRRGVPPPSRAEGDAIGSRPSGRVPPRMSSGVGEDDRLQRPGGRVTAPRGPSTMDRGVAPVIGAGRPSGRAPRASSFEGGGGAMRAPVERRAAPAPRQAPARMSAPARSSSPAAERPSGRVSGRRDP